MFLLSIRVLYGVDDVILRRNSGRGDAGGAKPELSGVALGVGEVCRPCDFRAPRRDIEATMSVSRSPDTVMSMNLGCWGTEESVPQPVVGMVKATLLLMSCFSCRMPSISSTLCAVASARSPTVVLMPLICSQRAARPRPKEL